MKSGKNSIVRAYGQSSKKRQALKQFTEDVRIFQSWQFRIIQLHKSFCLMLTLNSVFLNKALMLFAGLEWNPVPQPKSNTQNNTSLVPLKMSWNTRFYLLHLTGLYQFTQYLSTEFLPQINRVYLYQEPCCDSATILKLVFYSTSSLVCILLLAATEQIHAETPAIQSCTLFSFCPSCLWSCLGMRKTGLGT